jgi:hypothetical protein
MFGWHEWLEGNTLMMSRYGGKGVCPDCGDLACKLNIENFPLTCNEASLPLAVAIIENPDKSMGKF